MRIIRASENKIMPWKNGLGITREIDISPPGAEFSTGQFDFRISSALVSGTSAFSKFPEFDRILCVIQGTGIKINEDKYSLLEPFKFKGETEITGTPLDSEIIDLGIIYKRDRFTAHMEIFKGSQTPGMTESLSYVIAIAGVILVNDQILAAGDAARIDQRSTFKLETTEQARALIISLKTI